MTLSLYTSTPNKRPPSQLFAILKAKLLALRPKKVRRTEPEVVFNIFPNDVSLKQYNRPPKQQDTYNFRLSRSPTHINPRLVHPVQNSMMLEFKRLQNKQISKFRDCKSFKCSKQVIILQKQDLLVYWHQFQQLQVIKFQTPVQSYNVTKNSEHLIAVSGLNIKLFRLDNTQCKAQVLFQNVSQSPIIQTITLKQSCESLDLITFTATKNIFLLQIPHNSKQQLKVKKIGSCNESYLIHNQSQKQLVLFSGRQLFFFNSNYQLHRKKQLNIQPKPVPYNQQVMLTESSVLVLVQDKLIIIDNQSLEEIRIVLLYSRVHKLMKKHRAIGFLFHNKVQFVSLHDLQSPSFCSLNRLPKASMQINPKVTMSTLSDNDNDFIVYKSSLGIHKILFKSAGQVLEKLLVTDMIDSMHLSVFIFIKRPPLLQFDMGQEQSLIQRLNKLGLLMYLRLDSNQLLDMIIQFSLATKSLEILWELFPSDKKNNLLLKLNKFIYQMKIISLSPDLLNQITNFYNGSLDVLNMLAISLQNPSDLLVELSSKFGWLSALRNMYSKGRVQLTYLLQVFQQRAVQVIDNFWINTLKQFSLFVLEVGRSSDSVLLYEWFTQPSRCHILIAKSTYQVMPIFIGFVKLNLDSDKQNQNILHQLKQAGSLQWIDVYKSRIIAKIHQKGEAVALVYQLIKRKPEVLEIQRDLAENTEWQEFECQENQRIIEIIKLCEQNWNLLDLKEKSAAAGLWLLSIWINFQCGQYEEAITDGLLQSNKKIKNLMLSQLQVRSALGRMIPEENMKLSKAIQRTIKQLVNTDCKRALKISQQFFTKGDIRIVNKLQTEPEVQLEYLGALVGSNFYSLTEIEQDLVILYFRRLSEIKPKQFVTEMAKFQIHRLPVEKMLPIARDRKLLDGTANLLMLCNDYKGSLQVHLKLLDQQFVDCLEQQRKLNSYDSAERREKFRSVVQNHVNYMRMLCNNSLNQLELRENYMSLLEWLYQKYLQVNTKKSSKASLLFKIIQLPSLTQFVGNLFSQIFLQYCLTQPIDQVIVQLKNNFGLLEASCLSSVFKNMFFEFKSQNGVFSAMCQAELKRIYTLKQKFDLSSLKAYNSTGHCKVCGQIPQKNKKLKFTAFNCGHMVDSICSIKLMGFFFCNYCVKNDLMKIALSGAASNPNQQISPVSKIWTTMKQKEVNAVAKTKGAQTQVMQKQAQPRLLNKLRIFDRRVEELQAGKQKILLRYQLKLL